MNSVEWRRGRGDSCPVTGNEGVMFHVEYNADCVSRSFSPFSFMFHCKFLAWIHRILINIHLNSHFVSRVLCVSKSILSSTNQHQLHRSPYICISRQRNGTRSVCISLQHRVFCVCVCVCVCVGGVILYLKFHSHNFPIGRKWWRSTVNIYSNQFVDILKTEWRERVTCVLKVQ